MYPNSLRTRSLCVLLLGFKYIWQLLPEAPRSRSSVPQPTTYIFILNIVVREGCLFENALILSQVLAANCCRERTKTTIHLRRLFPTMPWDNDFPTIFDIFLSLQRYPQHCFFGKDSKWSNIKIFVSHQLRKPYYGLFLQISFSKWNPG